MSGVELLYQVYGQVVATAEDLPELLPALGQDPTLHYSTAEAGVCHQPPGDPIFASRLVTVDNTPLARIWATAGRFVLWIAEVGQYVLADRTVECRPLPGVSQAVQRMHLLATVLALWIEMQGTPVLHASAVVSNGLCAAFLADSGQGKSTLAAALLAAGAQLLTDDILPIQAAGGCHFGLPGYPCLRLWPAEAEHFLGHHADLPLIAPDSAKRWASLAEGFATFCSSPQTLACIYLPNRHDPTHGNDVVISPVHPRDGLIELLRYSFGGRAVEVMGLQPGRLDFFARMLRRVPVKRLIYPPGFEHLPRVRDAILHDMSTLPTTNGATDRLASEAA